jgi:cytochrome d ubiquinol oxidase subunit II
MSIDLPLVWAGIIAFAVFAYVVLDGFDLGIGMLFLTGKTRAERDQMMNSVAPVWDGNETWLVLGGGGLMAAFPLAYATVLPALYAPLIAMLLGLTMRGVAFEFRWRTERGKFLWDWAFFVGSLTAALAQGIALGALVQGIPIADRSYAGGWWDWLTAFSLVTGVAVATGYALLGAAWLNMKTAGIVQRRARRQAFILGAGLLGFIGIVSAWTPFLHPEYFERWFNWPAAIFSFVVPLLIAGCAWILFTSLIAAHERTPFFAALGFFILSFAGLGISFYPYIVPPALTIWQAAAPDKSLSFLLVGAVVLVPLILVYTAFSYWVFRGKTELHGGYH